MISRFEVYLVRLDPSEGHEIQRTRPCVVISPDDMNRYVRTVIVAPMTSGERPYPSRVAVVFQGRSGQVVLDQIRTVDRGRLVRRLGRIDQSAATQVIAVLAEMFAT